MTISILKKNYLTIQQMKYLREIIILDDET